MMKYHAPIELIGTRKLQGFGLRVKKHKDSNTQKVRFNVSTESDKQKAELNCNAR